MQTEWATKMKNDIYAALRDGPDGKAFARVVETVLSRDKNWVRWKEENCPEILRQPVAPDVFMQATDGARAACAWKRIRATPLGSLDLTFLSDSDHSNGVAKLQDSAR
jgi:THO complex subunit 1